MTAARRKAAWRRGRGGEWRACWRLRLGGWRILATNHKTPFGEIDIVARKGTILAFIEVKARPTAADAALALRPGQRRRIARAAQAFLGRHPALARLNVRFDLVLVLPWRFPRLLADAWRPDA